VSWANRPCAQYVAPSPAVSRIKSHPLARALTRARSAPSLSTTKPIHRHPKGPIDAPLQLSSPRLRLRPLRPGDAPALCAYRALPEVARYQSWDTCTPDDAARLIACQERLSPHATGAWLQLGLTLKDSGTLIGDCGIHFLKDQPHQVELGITLDPAHQRRGLAAEAVEAVLRHAFATLGKHRVIATTDVLNLPAARCFRRLGFRQEAHFVDHVQFKGAWSSEYLFAMLCREWCARPPNPDPEPR
jgi:RimJ/RimL family protein N-acetyltransferase